MADPDDARHRGRDQLVREGEPQWVIAKLAYHALDKGLEDEEVEIFALRDCRTWEKLGEARTTDGEHPHDSVAGVADTGGRIYFEIPAGHRLEVGLHRIRVVVKGDHSWTELYIDVVPANARVTVSDVDGTLTETEDAALWQAVRGGPGPATHPGAPEALRALAARGYVIVYLTARPEWFAPATHEWLTAHGFPSGIVHTTLGLTGAMGADAQQFKTEELTQLSHAVGRAPDFAFGNMPSDVAAYAAAKVPADHRYFFRLHGDAQGGHVIDSYEPLANTFAALQPACK